MDEKLPFGILCLFIYISYAVDVKVNFLSSFTTCRTKGKFIFAYFILKAVRIAIQLFC